jgi:hypothetical protein
MSQETAADNKSSIDTSIQYVNIILDLMKNHVLNIRGEQYLFSELELYYHSHDDTHKDPYVHKRAAQLLKNSWYFHKKSDTGKYTGGTFKGLDMTFGDGKNYVGVLIRSIKQISGSSLNIEGSCTCVNHILQKTETKDIAELVSKMQQVDDIFRVNEWLYVEKQTNPILLQITNSWKIYTSTRVGLSEGDSFYRDKPYRFVFLPGKFKKNQNQLAISVFQQVNDKNLVCELLNIKNAKLEEWLKAHGDSSTK